MFITVNEIVAALKELSAKALKEQADARAHLAEAAGKDMSAATDAFSEALYANAKAWPWQAVALREVFNGGDLLEAVRRTIQEARAEVARGIPTSASLVHLAQSMAKHEGWRLFLQKVEPLVKDIDAAP